MSTFKFASVADVWPVGTSVSAYLPGTSPAGGTSGSALATAAVASDGSLTLTGLADNTAYVATDGTRSKRFRTAPAATDDLLLSSYSGSPLAAHAMVQQAMNDAVASGRELLITPGIWDLGITQAAHSLVCPSGLRMRFAAGASFRWGMQDVYYPAIVAVGKSDIQIINPSLVWTGKLTYANDGLAHDFHNYFDAGALGQTPEINDADTADRYGSGRTDYLTRTYCSGIMVLQSNSVRIHNFTGVGSSAGSDKTNTIHHWIFTSRCNDVDITGVTKVDDCVIGVAQGGNNRGTIDRVELGRLNQDIGIPGHAVYSFMSDLKIGHVEDAGIENGANNTTLQGLHSVSIKGVGHVAIGSINSKRPNGALNIQGTITGAVSDVMWESGTLAPVSTTPKVYLVTAGYIERFVIDGLSLTTTYDEILLGGGSNDCIVDNAILCRTDNVAGTTGFMLWKGDGNSVKATLVQKGTADAPLISPWSGSAQRNTFELKLRNWHAAPVAELGRTDVLYNEFIIEPQGSGSTDVRNWPGADFGDPNAFWANNQGITYMSQNRVRYADGVTTWKKSFNTGAAVGGAGTVTATFPVPAGEWDCSAWWVAGAARSVQRLQEYLVRNRQGAAGQAPITDAQPVHTGGAQGSGLVSLVPATTYAASTAGNTPVAQTQGQVVVGITANVTDTTDNRVDCFFSMRRRA